MKSYIILSRYEGNYYINHCRKTFLLNFMIKNLGGHAILRKKKVCNPNIMHYLLDALSSNKEKKLIETNEEKIFQVMEKIIAEKEIEHINYLGSKLNNKKRKYDAVLKATNKRPKHKETNSSDSSTEQSTMSTSLPSIEQFCSHATSSGGQSSGFNTELSGITFSGKTSSIYKIQKQNAKTSKPNCGLVVPGFAPTSASSSFD